MVHIFCLCSSAKSYDKINITRNLKRFDILILSSCVNKKNLILYFFSMSVKRTMLDLGLGKCFKLHARREFEIFLRFYR